MRRQWLLLLLAAWCTCAVAQDPHLTHATADNSPSPTPPAAAARTLQGVARKAVSKLTSMDVMREALAWVSARGHAPLLQPKQLYALHAGQVAVLHRGHAKQLLELRNRLAQDKQPRTDGGTPESDEAALRHLHMQDILATSIKQTLQHLMLMAQLREQQSHESGLNHQPPTDLTDMASSQPGSAATSKPIPGTNTGAWRLREDQPNSSSSGDAGGSSDTASWSHGAPVQVNGKGDPAPHICVVVRTYRAHGPSPDGSHPGPLWQLLQSLPASGLQSWQVLIVMSDGQPFEALQPMVERMGDARVKIHTMLVGPEHAARGPNGAWNTGYHHALFTMTDLAIDGCAPETRWVTVTNGDNVYDPAFWREVAAGPQDANVLAFDFYSRYQRYTGRQCFRFMSLPDAPRCKENLLRFFNTDLASVAMDWKRWTAEKRGFSRVPMGDFEKGQGWHDAFAVHALMESGWHAHWVGPGTRCLVAHSPSPQLCAMEGGIWDDSTKDYGGPECHSQAQGMAKAQDPRIQLLQIELTHDPTSFVRQPDLPGSPASDPSPPSWPPSNYTVTCLRQAEEVLIQQTWNNPEFYHRCCALLDQPAPLLETTRLQLTTLHELHARSTGGLLAAAAGLMMEGDREEL